MLFRAKIALRSVCDITPQLLEKLGVCGLLLDIDNTLTTHDNPVPAAGVEAWVAGMQAAGISLCLVSNNHPPRVEPFAKRLGLDFVCEGKKPLTKGYREAVQKMGLSRKEVAAVGDQIFTDVLGARRCGFQSFCVEPVCGRDSLWHWTAYWLQNPFRITARRRRKREKAGKCRVQ